MKAAVLQTWLGVGGGGIMVPALAIDHNQKLGKCGVVFQTFGVLHKTEMTSLVSLHQGEDVEAVIRAQ